MAKRLDKLNKNKPESTRALIKILKKKSKKDKNSTTDDTTTYANHDAMTGYSSSNITQGSEK